MAGIVNREWSWNLNVKKGSTNESGVKVVVWDSDSYTAVVTQTTDSNGNITEQNLKEAIYSVTSTSTVSTDTKTPHVISCVKYGLVPFGININFNSARNDTFFVEDNDYITESSKTTVAAYTGITINHTTDTITLTSHRSILELYDYCQNEAYDSPQKDYPEGIMTTEDGINYFSYYDIINDGYQFDGKHKTISFASGKDFTVDSVGTIKDLKIIGDLIWGTQITVNNVDVTGTWYFDDSVNLSMTDCTVDTVDTVDGTETVVIGMHGDTSIDTNNDTSNITILKPVTLYIKATNSSGSAISGAMVYLKAAPGGDLTAGTQIIKDTTDSNGELTDTFNYTNDQPVTGRIRKATTSPYYKTYNLGGSITSNGYRVEAIMIEDI